MVRPYALRIGFVALTLLTLVTTACSSDTATGRLETVAPTVAAQELDTPGVVVLDVRTAEEFVAGHLADAVNIDFYAADFRNQLSDLDRDAPYVLYCRSGNRSAQTLELMRELGFTNVVDVDGGIVAWVTAGLPIQ